jgi:D-glycero-D-manno-heptose 1,7-bisphosphate phosphatase
MKKAVFLDRDGVINKALLVDGIPRPPTTVAAVEILDGVSESLKLLAVTNFEVVVVTNQPDVARGIVTQESVEDINTHLQQQLGIQHFFSCYHDNHHKCDCRKPNPGLLHRAALELELDLSTSFMVGDRWRDVAAGQAAGCKCYFIDYGYMEKSPVFPFTRVFSLIEAVQHILESTNGPFG